MRKVWHREAESCSRSQSTGVRIWTQRHCNTRVPEMDHWLLCSCFYRLGNTHPGCGSGSPNTWVSGGSWSPSPELFSWYLIDLLGFFSPIVQLLFFKFQIGFNDQESQDHFSMSHLYLCFQGRRGKKKVSNLENETFCFGLLNTNRPRCNSNHALYCSVINPSELNRC